MCLGPDQLEPYFLKLAAEFIAQPLSHLYNLCLLNNEVRSIWKYALVLPLLKGGDPSNVNTIGQFAFSQRSLKDLLNN